MRTMRKKIALFLAVLALFVSGAVAQDKPGEFTLTVVSTSDTHGYGLTPSARNIGYSRLRGYVDLLRADKKYVLLLDSGDAIAGNAAANLDRGEGAVDVLNAVQYDAAAMGNHENDFGYQRLLELKPKMAYPFLAANVFKDGKAQFEPYIIKSVNNVNIALVGVVTPEYAPKELTVEDPVAALARLMPELREKAGVVIVMAHLGEERQYTAKRLAASVQGIDLILDGHDHVPTPAGIAVGDTLIVNPGAEMVNIGETTLRIVDGKVAAKSARLVGMADEKLKSADSPSVSAVLAAGAKKNEAILKRTVAMSPVNLEGDRAVIRKDDTNLGRLLTDAFRADSGADIALMNAGWIRTGAKAGVVTMQDVLNILAIGGSVVTIPMTGAEVAQALEMGFALYPEPNASFFQVSGLTFDADAKKPAGQRVSNIQAGGAPIAAGKTYTVAVLDLLANLGIQGRTTGGVVAGVDTRQVAIFGGGIIKVCSVSTEAFANYLAANPDAFKAAEARRVTIK